jgi:hypothetical protein
VIISHRHQFIFFPVPKTGTHSVRQALRPHMADDDLEQVGLFVQKKFPFPELSEIGHGHLSVAQVRPVLGADTFDRYFKFTFVRNPYDRFVSYCAFMSRHAGHFVNEPREFMRYILLERRPLNHVHFRPQYEMLVDANGALAMDFVGKCESMQHDYDAVCTKLGVASTTLERANASSHQHFAEYYDAELKALVADFYRRDFELFGYDLD